MDFFKGSAPKDTRLKEELSVLATTIESINQRLSTGGRDFDASVIRAIANIDKKLAYLYDQTKQSKQEILSGFKTQLSNESQGTRELFKKDISIVSNTVNTRLERMDRIIQNLSKRSEEQSEEVINATKNNAMKIDEHSDRLERIEQHLSIMNERFSAIIDLYRLEIKVLKDHNHILKKKFNLPFEDDELDSIDPSKLL